MDECWLHGSHAGLHSLHGGRTSAFEGGGQAGGGASDQALVGDFSSLTDSASDDHRHTLSRKQKSRPVGRLLVFSFLGSSPGSPGLDLYLGLPNRNLALNNDEDQNKGQANKDKGEGHFSFFRKSCSDELGSEDN